MMIPWTVKASVNEARYTKLLKDCDSLSQIQTLLYAFDNTNGLYNHFYAMFRYHEINDEDEEVFVNCVKDTYDEYHDYYDQLVKVYNHNVDVDKLTEKTTSRIDTSEGNTDVSTRGTSSGTSSTESSSSTNNDSSSSTKDYDLPNTQVSSVGSGNLSTQENVDATSTNESESSNNTSNTSTDEKTSSEARNNEYTSDISSKDNKDFIRLKEQYMAHIRDIYEEFATRFSDCFLHIF